MRVSPFALALLAALTLPCIANAKGTVTVRQVDGSVQIYPNLTLRVVGKTLRLTTADKKGALIITDAACSHVEKLIRCLPYAAELQQHGTRSLTVSRGTIYYNPTSQTQQLKYSSTQIPPNGVLGIIRSQVGTYLTISGRLDGRAQR